MAPRRSDERPWKLSSSPPYSISYCGVQQPPWFCTWSEDKAKPKYHLNLGSTVCQIMHTLLVLTVRSSSAFKSLRCRKNDLAPWILAAIIENISSSFSMSPFKFRHQALHKEKNDPPRSWTTIKFSVRRPGKISCKGRALREFDAEFVGSK